MPKRVLLVEGNDDLHVTSNLFLVRKVPDVFEVRASAKKDENGGWPAILDKIRPELQRSGLERLALVADADEKGPISRWQAIRSRLCGSAGYDDTVVPKNIDLRGTVFELPAAHGRKPIRFGAWIMPNNQNEGMLENFVARMIRDDDAMLSRVDSFLDLIQKNERRFSETHRPKARIHSWLAVSERPGRPMGQAIRADGHLDANHPTVQPFLDWVQRALVND